MSLKQMILAFNVDVGNPVRKLVLLKLADQANDDGQCWPSYATIAKAAEVDRRTAIRKIRELRDNGLLTIHERKRGNGSATSNVYQLTLVSQSHYPSVTESLPPSVTESPPEPIIIEPIIETVTPEKPTEALKALSKWCKDNETPLTNAELQKWRSKIKELSSSGITTERQRMAFLWAREKGKEIPTAHFWSDTFRKWKSELEKDQEYV